MKHANAGISAEIRERASRSFVLPARRAGKRRFSIAVRDVLEEMGERGKGAQTFCCSALKASSFLRENGLVLEGIDGPPSGRGTSTVYHYAIDPAGKRVDSEAPMSQGEARALAEHYLAPLLGMLEKEVKSMGGTEAFMRWVRSDQHGT